MMPLGALPYIGSLVAGSLLAVLCPNRLLLPLFFILIGTVSALTVFAHRVPTPGYWTRPARAIAALLMVVAGPDGTEARGGLTPKLLIASLLGTVGFVAALLLA